ncbi:hypothetical protein ACFW35_18335 [Fictibacillus sp. NPDC058756]|uniref:hypothetical protein n=1 Tax=Fictibacillus sp. NPDC058756 TaxID=3346625 RepID=UPI0036B91E40
MKQETKERIKKINMIDSEKLPMTLLKSLEVFWSLDRIIDNNMFYFQGQVDEYVHSKRLSEEIKDWINELGERISSDYLNQGYGKYFTLQLMEYLGFDNDNETTEDIIDDYCMSGEKDKDITKLKMLLIESALELDKMM